MREHFLPFALPAIGEEEIAEVIDSLRSGWVTTGAKTKRFEEQFRQYVGSTHAIAVNSCTAGLHVALTALGVGPGDEVIVPTLTFCSTANVVVHLGARPRLVDVGPDFNVIPDAISRAITPQTKAIIPVHYGGQACDLDAIYAVAARYGISVIEDAAHAVGCTYHGLKVGSDALHSAPPTIGAKTVSVFSFYATKNMTTGEGGMITTGDTGLAERMRLLTLHGMTRDAWKRYTSVGSWDYDVVDAGYKSNMTDIQASLGIHQLRKLDTFIEERRRYARMYDEAFAERDEIETPITHSDRSNHVYHLYVIRLNLNRLRIDRGQFIEELKMRNIGTSVHFKPVHLHSFYQKRFGYSWGDFPTAERLYERLISLPLYPRMREGDVDDTVAAVREIVERFRKKLS